MKAVWAGIRRTHGSAPERAAPISVALLRRMVDVLPSGLGGERDRALLLVGFAAALRRSELVALDVADVAEREEGLVVTPCAENAEAGAACERRDWRGDAVREMEEGVAAPWPSGIGSAREGSQTTARGVRQERGS